MHQMKYELKNIHVWPAIKIVFSVSLLTGFLFCLFHAVIVALTSVVISTVVPEELISFIPSSGLAMIFLGGFAAIGAAIFITLAALVFILIYNFLANWMGGITIDFERK